MRLTVADGPAHSARAVIRFRHQQVALARELAALFNTRVSEDDWLLVVPIRELDLALAMQPLAIRLAPTSDEVEAAIKQPSVRWRIGLRHDLALACPGWIGV